MRCSTAPKADVEFTVKTMEAYFPHCCGHRAESRQGAASPRDPSLPLILQPPPGLMPLSSEPGTSSDPVSLLAETEDARSSSPTSPVTQTPEPGSVSGSSNLERGLAAIHLLVEDGCPKLLLPYQMAFRSGPARWTGFGTSSTKSTPEFREFWKPT